MPVRINTEYKPPFVFRNAHLHTIIPSLFRKVKDVNYVRERLELPDGDFMDLDWSKVGSDKVAIVLHGLEGSAESGYMKGIIRALNSRGWDGVAVNQRGCSGEPNRLLRAYHSGATEDLNEVLAHILYDREPKEVVLIGFSLGGNIVLKYAGERGAIITDKVKKIIAVSVPCHLSSGAVKLSVPANRVYINRFLKRLKKKVKNKEHLLPESMKGLDMKQIKDFKDFDDYFTAPVHGFRHAEDYWEQCSSVNFIEGIKRPTLILNAADDPFLSEECYPKEAAEKNEHVLLEITKYGGHTGFVSLNKAKEFWHERRIAEFIERG